MKVVSIQQADSIYGCSGSCEIERSRVSVPVLSQINTQVSDLVRLFAELDEDQYWLRPLQKLKQIRFRLNSVPAAFAEILNSSSACQDFIKSSLNVPYQFPDAADQVESLVTLLKTIREVPNPILGEVIRLSADEHVAVLVKESRCVDLAKKSLPKHVEVVVPQQLKTSRCFPSMVIVGTTNWYPAYVFTAPRASMVTLVHLDTHRDRWVPSPVFAATDLERGPQIYHGRLPREKDSISAAPALPAAPIDFTPMSESEWAAFASAAVRNSGNQQEHVEAKLFLLESGAAVFLEADDLAHSRVIDLDPATENAVRKLPVTQINPGMFVVLRDGNGGDYVADVANHILGADARKSRDWQKQWKFLLRQKVNDVGASSVIEQLKRDGCSIANDQNLRNWMSFNSIKPRELTHFAAILKLVGLSEHLKALWALLMRIDNAHKAAGKQISKELTQLLNESDHWTLQRDGFMEVRLKEHDCGRLCAVRVVDIHEETISVDPSAIGRIIRDTELENGADDADVSR